ncbi:hypothetical protein BC826DRAFT_1035445 [Russula brevipes]|nr:hypothetical protein BC826DRAFT_1035445 [Russula brevipes]
MTATRLSRTGDRVRSHNVHTQAWDVCQIVSWSVDEVAKGKSEGKCVLESLRGLICSANRPHGVCRSFQARVMNTRISPKHVPFAVQFTSYRFAELSLSSDMV